MQNQIFNPADWVYVPDGMGRLGKGYYKNKENPAQRISVSVFERKRGEAQEKGGVDYEQNMNIYGSSPGGDRLAVEAKPQSKTTEATLTPWDNPVYGEQSAEMRVRSAEKEKTPNKLAQTEGQQDEKTSKPAPPPQNQPENKESNSADSESEAGSEGTVICTELYRRGLMSLGDYRNSHLYAQTRLPAAFMRGYQFWAIPYVGLMKRFEAAVAFILPFVRWRTREILFRLGEKERGSYRGKLLCMVHDGICVALGTHLLKRGLCATHREQELVKA